MGRSLGTPANEPAGEFVHQPSGSTVRILWKNGVMHHRVEERGLSADYPIVYSIGKGKVGKSYLMELGGHLFQSPAAYYSTHSEWNAAPGYESEHVLDFSRAITSDCLFCHTGSVKQTAAKTELAPISCDRCHGPLETHLQRPIPGSIVNPAKLSVRERDSVCEQCHLEGATTVLNPDRGWWDFRPGQALEQFETNYVYRTTDDQRRSLPAVSQAEQLALSACLRGSGGKLWCGTCHDPHGTPVNRKQQIKQICESCHVAAQIASNHVGSPDNCVECHMPSRQAGDVSHAAVTDHRITKYPEAPPNPKTDKFLAAWHDPPAGLAERNLGLALFYTARQQHSREGFQQAFRVLSRLPGDNDPPVAAAKGYMLLGSGEAQRAVEYFKVAVRKTPNDAEYWLDLGVAEGAVNDSSQAIAALQRSIEENPYDYRPYKALADLYKRTDQIDKVQLPVDRFLKLVPESIGMRLPR